MRAPDLLPPRAWDLLAPLDERERARVLAAGRARSFRRGEVVFHEGDPGETIHFVRLGRLAVRVSTPQGDVATLTLLSPGQAFGELALVDDAHRRTATVVALEDSETLALSRASFTAILQRHPAVEGVLVSLLARRVEELSGALLGALYVGVEQRVLRRLLELAHIYGGPGPGQVTIPITQDDLAGMAGTTRPTVNQLLQGLAAAGILALGRGRIVVTDTEALRRAVRSGR